jgi:hypothetical protein
MNDIEVYKQSGRFATELEVGNDLGVVDRTDGVDRLDFNDNHVFDEEVESAAGVELNAAIFDRNRNLSGTRLTLNGEVREPSKSYRRFQVGQHRVQSVFSLLP